MVKGMHTAALLSEGRMEALARYETAHAEALEAHMP